MKLKAITIFGFRGLKEFAVEYDSNKALLLFGYNGTGKSSLFQALHYGITGELPDLMAGIAPD